MTLVRTISVGAGGGPESRLGDLKSECTKEKITNSTSLGRHNLNGRQEIRGK